ncbi:MAG: ATP-binding cassette domain-containing protein [Thermodesulfobacteriota bacterium]
MEQAPIISVENLTAGYGGKAVLKDVTFAVAPGEIVVLVGGSGCGKSTLLKHMIGLLPPMKGRVIIDGVNVAGADEKTYHDLLTRIGILYQSGALLGSLTVAENVALPLFAHTDLSREGIFDIVRLKLASVGLSGYESYLPSEISGGMAKRAGLARAMALNPKILFFDEPSAGLDPITAADLDRLILTLNRIFGTTMVIVTHELRSIFTVARRAVMLDKKKMGILAVGDPRRLRDESRDPTVRRFFNPEEPSAEV